MATASATSSSLSASAMVKQGTCVSGVSPSPAKLGCSRRLLVPALVGAPFLLHQKAAFAKDIPLFGLRKRVEEAEKEVVKEVKEIVTEGEQLVKKGEKLVIEGEKEISRLVAPPAAKDIPLFGLRKRVEQAEKEVVKEIVTGGEQLVKKGEKLVIEGAPAAAGALSTPINSPPPAYQAAAVAGAELVAVLIASSVVNGLVNE